MNEDDPDELMKVENRVGSLEEERNQNEVKMLQLRKQNVEVKLELVKSNKEVAESKDRINDLETKNGELEGKVDKLGEKMDGQVIKREQVNAGLVGQINDHEETHQKLSTMIDEGLDQVQTKVEQRMKKLEDSSKELEQLKT